jgi:hypothetical protein
MKSIETSWERRDLFLTTETVMANMLLASTCQFPDHEGAIFSGSGIGESEAAEDPIVRRVILTPPEVRSACPLLGPAV